MKDGALCNWGVDKKKIFVLGIKNKVKHEISNIINNDINSAIILNGTDEFSFTINYDSSYEKEYNSLMYDTILLYEDFGVYYIYETNEVQIEDYRYKEVKLYSYEQTLNNLLFTLYDKTETSDSYYQCELWNENPSVNSVLRDIILKRPNWKVGHVDESLLNSQRSFAVSTQQPCLSFMYDKISSNFNCEFRFDTFKKEISAYEKATAVQDTGIVLTIDQYIKELNKTPITTDICTCLDVTGGNLDIARVNPNGTRKIYDFSRFYDRMSIELVVACELWRQKIERLQGEYEIKFAEWSEAETTYQKARAKRDSLDAEHMRYNMAWVRAGDVYGDDSEENTQARWNYFNWCASSGYDQAWETIDEYREIRQAKKAELDTYNEQCKMENNFTQEQLIELSQFTIDKQYSVSAYACPKKATEQQKGEVATMLYNDAKKALQRFNAVKYQFTVTLSNFCAIAGIDEEYFASQLNVSKYVTIIDKSKTKYKMIVSRISMNGNDLSNIEIEFSDSLTFHEQYSELNDWLNNYQAMANDNMDKLSQDVNNQFDDIGGRFDGVDANVNNLWDSVKDLSKNGGKLEIALCPDQSREKFKDGRLGGIIPDGTTIEVNEETGLAKVIGVAGEDDFVDSIEYYNDGFGYNGRFGFQWQANGDIYCVHNGVTIKRMSFGDSVMNHITKRNNKEEEVTP